MLGKYASGRSLLIETARHFSLSCSCRTRFLFYISRSRGVEYKSDTSHVLTWFIHPVVQTALLFSPNSSAKKRILHWTKLSLALNPEFIALLIFSAPTNHVHRKSERRRCSQQHLLSSVLPLYASPHVMALERPDWRLSRLGGNREWNE